MRFKVPVIVVSESADDPITLSVPLTVVLLSLDVLSTANPPVNVVPCVTMSVPESD